VRVIRRDDSMSAEVRPPQGSFTGPAGQRPLHESGGHDVRVSFVQFENGAWTGWHTHAGGQVLHVLEGRGRVAGEHGAEQAIEPGDTIVTGPGERHRHGAAEGAEMTHLAVTIGEVVWFDEEEGEPDAHRH
jgi:quercetin dioxygenase-like cupin family protein